MKAIAVRLCGQILLLDESGQQDTDYLPGYSPSAKRKVFCQQQPNPLEGQTWQTEGIEELLVPMRETYTDAKGEYCFTATKGLWLVWPETSP